ncbi:MAG TPA: hypothetical protein VJT49_15885 [Amycolatopsis sp.]|uniref:hypothetical protein n=1 Tax=Amycolatopsis sp. TaxID=37632 RepID=UPI002B460ECB|nr:hypothetical protein [Amycolatopsis sp.]HKS46559.1 hypothetical protein [Amycolatopsis sp.]
MPAVPGRRPRPCGTFLGLFAVTGALVGALVFVLATRQWPQVMYPMVPRAGGEDRCEVVCVAARVPFGATPPPAAPPL